MALFRQPAEDRIQTASRQFLKRLVFQNFQQDGKPGLIVLPITLFSGALQVVPGDFSK